MCIIYCTNCINIPGLVLDHLAVLIPAHLDPGGQAAGQLLEQGRGGGGLFTHISLMDPQLIRRGDDMVPPQSDLHDGPDILDYD